MTWELPDRVVRWIGHSGEHLGEDNDEAGMKQKFFAAYTKVGVGAGNVAQSLKGKGKDNVGNNSIEDASGGNGETTKNKTDGD